MANVDRPNGFIPVGTIDGSPYNAAGREYSVADTYATAIFVGDAVEQVADGSVEAAKAGTGNPILGIVTGIKVTGGKGTVEEQGNFLSSGNLGVEEHPGYGAASTARRVLVETGPDVLYEVQADGILAITDLGLNVALIAGAGSTTTGISAHEINSASEVATTEQFRLVDFKRTPDNDVASANSRWIVRINEHQLREVAGI